MGTMITNSEDIVGFLIAQHHQIEAMFQQVRAVNGGMRADAFFALRRLMAVHETAEEEIVHPVAASTLPNGKAIVMARLTEENEAKRVLTELEDLSVDSAEFETKFRMLQASVLAHAEAEEREEFDRLAVSLHPDRLHRMKQMALFAEAIAPTRPHAGIESAIGNILVGPFASMVDRASDYLSGKSPDTRRQPRRHPR